MPQVSALKKAQFARLVIHWLVAVSALLLSRLKQGHEHLHGHWCFSKVHEQQERKIQLNALTEFAS
jgi:hypothetical protein